MRTSFLPLLLGLVLFGPLLLTHCESKEEPSSKEEKKILTKEKTGLSQKAMHRQLVDSINARLMADSFLAKTPEKQAQLVMKAINVQKAYVNNHPKDSLSPAYLMNIGQLFAQFLQDYEPALRHWQNLVREYPDYKRNPEVYMLMANTYHRMGMNKKAIEQVNYLKARYPDHYLSEQADEYINTVLKKSDSELSDYLKDKNKDL